MEPISNSGQGFRSGLSRLRSYWQQNGCIRHVVCGLLVHVILPPCLAAALLFPGCPIRIVEVVALVCALFLAYGLEQAIDAKLRG